MNNYKEKILKNGLIGMLSDETPIMLYCNEKDKKRGKFLFKCGEGCKHNPIKQIRKQNEKI